MKRTRVAMLVTLGLACCRLISASPPVAVNIDGVITPITIEIVDRALDLAKKENAPALLLRLNTTGGSIAAQRELSARLRASAVPVMAELARPDQHPLFLPDAAGVAAWLEARTLPTVPIQVQPAPGTPAIEYQLTLRERIVSLAADPNIGFVLLALGLLGIGAECSAPGLIFPGALGGVLAVLGFSSLVVLPVNWMGVALLILGSGLFVVEAKVHGRGLLAVTGTIAVVLGALFLIDGPPELRIHLATALAVSIPFAATSMFLLTVVLRSRANKMVGQ